MDIIIIAISYYAAQVIIGNQLVLQPEIGKKLITTIIMAIIIYGGILEIFKTYKNITRYENGNDYLIYVLACLISCTIMIFFNVIPVVPILDERTNLIASLIIVTSIIGYRVFIRLILNEGTTSRREREDTRKNVLVIGAGEATKVLLTTIKNSMKDTYKVVGLIDDNENKLNYAISGNKILGTRYDIPRICKENNVEVIFFTISNISPDDRRKILEICQETGCKVRILPGTKELIKDKPLIQSFRDVQIEDLLGRDPIKLDNKNIGKLIENKVVLVTGGGGSIGSELCRQIIKFKPSKLVIVDIYENNLYDIEQELKFNYPDMKIDAIVASVREKHRLNEIFEQYHPYLVFHAAAHKHVPLMETSPLEAIKNNVFGTYNTVKCADEYGVKRFILISTDKAVNPTNIMGATKRLCELIIQAKNKVSKTEYAAVRFGNVLGSNGSVVPLFKKQIAKGGPVTVTHKEITRFFMTIPEAVSLVLQAMSGAKGGEIFVLDMGEPVKIYDMAIKLIKLSGLEPNVDIQIKVTGLRPGEKLYEELLMAEEGLTETKHDKIHVARPSDIDMEKLEAKLAKLQYLLDNTNNEQKDEIKDVISEVVPTYRNLDKERTKNIQ
jgi:capsular polysaccharide biosynthesis protein